MRTLQDYLEEVAEEDCTKAETITLVWECDPDAMAVQLLKVLRAPHDELHLALAEFRDWLQAQVTRFYSVKIEAMRRLNNAHFYEREDAA